MIQITQEQFQKMMLEKHINSIQNITSMCAIGPVCYAPKEQFEKYEREIKVKFPEKVVENLEKDSKVDEVKD